MKEETVSMIHREETTYSIWRAVHDQMLPDTKDSEAQFKDSIYYLKKGTRSLDEYISKFKEICDKLAIVGKLFFDVDKVFQLSKGLGKQCKDL